MNHLSIGFEFETGDMSFVKCNLKTRKFEKPHEKGSRRNYLQNKNLKIDIYGDHMPEPNKALIVPLNTDYMKLELIDKKQATTTTYTIENESIYSDDESVFNNAEFVITYPNERDDISIENLDNHIYSHFEKSIIHIRNILLTCTQYKIKIIAYNENDQIEKHDDIDDDEYFYFFELPSEQTTISYGFLSMLPMNDIDKIQYIPQLTLGCQIIDVIPIVKNYNKIFEQDSMSIPISIITKDNFFPSISNKQQHDFYNGLLFLFVYQLERTFLKRKNFSYILLRDSLQHLKRFLKTKQEKEWMIEAIRNVYHLYVIKYKKVLQEDDQITRSHQKKQELLTLINDIFTRSLTAPTKIRQRQFISDVGLIPSDLNKKKVYIEFRLFRYNVFDHYHLDGDQNEYRLKFELLKKQIQQRQRQQKQEQEKQEQYIQIQRPLKKNKK
jgi:hypothetical protein